MDTIYVRINIDPKNRELEEIREEGLFFSNIADALCIERENVVEIDEQNYIEECNNIKKRWERF